MPIVSLACGVGLRWLRDAQELGHDGRRDRYEIHESCPIPRYVDAPPSTKPTKTPHHTNCQHTLLTNNQTDLDRS